MKTAVEWFVEELEMNILWTDKARKAVQQAKEMEKEQIIDAWNTKSKIDGVLTYTDNRTANHITHSLLEQSILELTKRAGLMHTSR